MKQGNSSKKDGKKKARPQKGRAIQWANVKVRLGDLTPWDDNPRMSTPEDAKALLESWQELGQFETIAIGPNGDVYNGHQRLSALLAAYGESYGIDARQSSRTLSRVERRKLTILAHAGATGRWDMGKLAEWNPDELAAWGLSGERIEARVDELAQLAELIGMGPGLQTDEMYTRNIEAPVYKSTGPKPNEHELYDTQRTRALVAEIQRNKRLTEDEREFLIVAAQRHTVLNFKRIADYYAHAPRHVQRLMEDSALVIIDFGRAIELGYVKLAQQVAGQYGVEYGDA